MWQGKRKCHFGQQSPTLQNNSSRCLHFWRTLFTCTVILLQKNYGVGKEKPHQTLEIFRISTQIHAFNIQIKNSESPIKNVNQKGSLGWKSRSCLFFASRSLFHMGWAPGLHWVFSNDVAAPDIRGRPSVICRPQTDAPASASLGNAEEGPTPRGVGGGEG